MLWLTDITEHWTGEGKLYLCAVKDVCSNRIVGYSISDRMKAALAVDALNSAVARRGHDVVAAAWSTPIEVASSGRRKFVAALNAHGLHRLDGPRRRGR